MDRWWRQKHKVPFMSKIHQEISFLAQLQEYYEDELFDNYEHEEYIPNSGDFIKIDETDKSSIIQSMREEFERDMLGEDG